MAPNLLSLHGSIGMPFDRPRKGQQVATNDRSMARVPLHEDLVPELRGIVRRRQHRRGRGYLVTPETIVIRRIPSLVRSLLPPPLWLGGSGRGEGSAGGKQRGPLVAERGGHAGRDGRKAGGNIGRLDRIGSEVVEGGLAAG